MMPAGNLVKMVAANTTRSPRHFILSAFGIVIAIATFVLFLASTEQVAAVLEKIFPVEEVEAIPPKAMMVQSDPKNPDPATADTPKTRPEVKRAWPRTRLA